MNIAVTTLNTAQASLTAPQFSDAEITADVLAVLQRAGFSASRSIWKNFITIDTLGVSWELFIEIRWATGSPDIIFSAAADDWSAVEACVALVDEQLPLVARAYLAERPFRAVAVPAPRWC